MLHKSSGTYVPPSKDSVKNSEFPLRIALEVGLICAQCSKSFFPTNQRGPVPQYCSRACQSAGYRAKRIAAELERVA